MSRASLKLGVGRRMERWDHHLTVGLRLFVPQSSEPWADPFGARTLSVAPREACSKTRPGRAVLCIIPQRVFGECEGYSEWVRDIRSAGGIFSA